LVAGWQTPVLRVFYGLVYIRGRAEEAATWSRSG
jgi:hypothetical protein